jgi:formylglycine-generating enzyme required for sulfatase activity
MDEMRKAIRQPLLIKILSMMLLLLPVSAALPAQDTPTRADNGAFSKIPAGEFLMGSENGLDNEKPPHRIKISRGFEIGKYEVTQAQWEALMGSNPSRFKGPDLPVEQVSWEDAQAFIEAMNTKQEQPDG